MSAVLQDVGAGPRWFQWQEGMEIEPGAWLDVPNALYHAGPGISKSGLDLIHESPATYRVMKDNPKPGTAAMQFGSAFHAAVLEPHIFERDYIPDPFNGSRAKAAIEARAALEAEGKILVGHNPNPETIWDRGEWDTIRFMRDAVLAHPEASIFLEPDDGLSEVSWFWVDPDVRRLCKCRHDRWNESHRLICDLKTTVDASLTGFQRAVHDFRYDVAAAWYQDGTRRCGQMIQGMIFIACEKKPPYHVATYEIDPEWVRQGRIKYQNDLRLYDQCMREQDWPGLPNITRVLPLPGYAKFNPIP